MTDEKTRSSAAAISNLEVLNNTGKSDSNQQGTRLEHDRNLSSLRHEKYRRVINVLADVIQQSSVQPKLIRLKR